ncbi:MAG: hypothetical protein IKU58_02390 [Clostridia bacterium]|nr:hypothetical protein [Clostridia bacterium]
MLPWLMGFAGFGLYLLYDIDSFAGLWKPLRTGFLLGTLLIGASTLLQMFSAWRQGAFSGLWDILLLMLGLAAFAALIYCLFFALPFTETYTDPAQGRRVYTCGAYALCRHPGILCFFAMYLFWGLAALPTGFLWCGMVFSVLNLVYAWFQDRVTFPKTFCDYTDYREKAPFLLPTAASFHRAVKTWGHPYEKEEEL